MVELNEGIVDHFDLDRVHKTPRFKRNTKER